jgi:hypothetical protein
MKCYLLLRCDGSPTFRRNVLPPSSGSKTPSRSGVQAQLVPLADYLHGSAGLNLKLEAIRSFGTSVNVYRTARRHISKDSPLHSHRCEKLKFIFSFTGRWRKVLFNDICLLLLCIVFRECLLVCALSLLAVDWHNELMSCLQRKLL